MAFVPMPVGMSVKNEVEVGREVLGCLFGVVDDHDSAAGPINDSGWIRKVHSVSFGFVFEPPPFAEIVISVYAEKGNLERCEMFEDLGLRDVACVNDSFDVLGAKEFDDSLDIGHSIVGIPDDSDSHPPILSRPRLALWRELRVSGCAEFEAMIAVPARTQTEPVIQGDGIWQNSSLSRRC